MFLDIYKGALDSLKKQSGFTLLFEKTGSRPAAPSPCGTAPGVVGGDGTRGTETRTAGTPPPTTTIHPPPPLPPAPGEAAARRGRTRGGRPDRRSPDDGDRSSGGGGGGKGSAGAVWWRWGGWGVVYTSRTWLR